MMIIGTRGSKLALAQAEIVASHLSSAGIETEIHIIKTVGDVDTDNPLHKLPGIGVFVREIDEYSLAGDIDIAVHSMKDLPTVRPEKLVTAAILKRDPPCDVLITRDGVCLADMPAGAVIGTSSMRRIAQMRRFRSDLKIADLRGNINTRMKRLRDGDYDGIILAEAGLVRLGWDIGFERLDPERFVPSANQGTIAVATLRGSEAEDVVRMLDHHQTRIETEIERIVIGVLGGGCSIPIGAFAEIVGSNSSDADDADAVGAAGVVAGGDVRVRAEVLAMDGRQHVRVDEMIPVDGYALHARRVGDALKAAGGDALVKEAATSI
ncbi:MAG: hydroxymethylbilane synthase [Euryarchaeota archaeon]|nr:hydroxymethylbilane synthase [Euryarchaeota archaeon]